MSIFCVQPNLNHETSVCLEKLNQRHNEPVKLENAESDSLQLKLMSK